MILALLIALPLLFQEPEPKLTHGPLRGACDTMSIDFWARASVPGEYTLELKQADRSGPAPVVSKAEVENDLTLHWHIEELAQGAKYSCRIQSGKLTLYDSGERTFEATISDSDSKATLVFGSCCEEKLRPDQPIWGTIESTHPDALVLLGDTPYIDSTNLGVQRSAYREFFNFAPIRRSLLGMSCYFTWDDHDYASNDQYGLITGRENSRRAFLEYHASQNLGVDGEGIFTSFRRGPVEVFVLDTRWFADIEPSVLAKDRRSLLGAKQSAWLKHGLLSSSAPFKILTCGMVWNDAVRPGKKDCWGNWLDERDGLLRWIGEKHISGLVLVGGDIHRSRVILHPFKSMVGYDVPEFISSPLAQSVIEAAKVDAPGLLFDVGAPASFLWMQTGHTDRGLEIRGRVFDGAGTQLFEKSFSMTELFAR